MVWVVPRGVYTLTLKSRGVLIEGSIEELREELYMFKREVQHVVDTLWELGKLPTLSQAHQLFYRVLREKGFRAHQAKQVYKYALGLVKATKRNGGRKPVLRKLFARLDRYDAVVDLGNQVVVVKLRDRVFKIKLVHHRSYLAKFYGRKWYEVILSIDGQGRIWVSIPFRWDYKPYKPRKLISIDVNLRKITVYDGENIRRIDTRFTEALSLKIHAEKLQEKYPRMWRYNDRILNRIRSLHKRSRNIVIDWCRKFAKHIVLKAKRVRSAIALEDLGKLWFNASKKPGLAAKLSRFAYRKLQVAIISKAIEYNVPVLLVNPRNTSTTCPRCSAELSYTHRLAVCPRCRLITDRDTVGAMNIYLRAQKGMYPSPGSRANAPAMKDETRQSRRTIHEPMTTHIKSYTNI